MWKIFDSADFPGHERVDAWQHVASSTLLATRYHTAEPSAFAARLEVMPLGEAHIGALAYTALSSCRPAELVRRSDPENYYVAFIRSGRQGIEQNRTRSLAYPGELVLYDSSRPFEASCRNGSAGATTVLQFPKRLLRLPEAQVARLHAIPLPAAHGIGRLLARFVIALTEERIELSESDAIRLGHTAIDLTAAVLAHRLDGDAPKPASQSHVLYVRILSYINENLHSPDLDPAVIAAAHHISVRYLHRIFQRHHGTGVSAYIRAQRLDHCRRDLADPTLNHVTIAATAVRWGFARPADFSRAFRRETGLSPSDYRTAAHAGSL
ncbi:helix-turn-helix domain-containing protein [Spongiactinospora sp. TRM90649]|uniref:helix-turn-helix domain-containing protein n=1 Tax=Spongiactinospora sp. TRM90649 TaxID=3031114 RepID=UPI0023F9D11D|nr:helix-turn-helix domain-containing protein [Spongiactinospora sp. TRM90649]MDF5759205.1 helix-turn-helix domain-containing protein [Spongiactinospora sp. TRM90649]